MGFPTFVRWRSPVEGYGRSMTVDYMIPIFVDGVDGALRIDPERFDFRLYASAAHQHPPLTLAQWADTHDLVAAINATIISLLVYIYNFIRFQ